MRQQFVQCKTRRQAMNVCAWASVAMKVTDGYICFESWTDYYTAKNQK